MTTDYKTLCPDPLESQTLKAKLPNTGEYPKTPKPQNPLDMK